MRITRIDIQNFLGISMLSVDELGKINVVTGDNGVGKSSVLKAITEAFRSSGVDPEIIHSGADNAEIIIKLDCDIEIERSITPSGNTVKVTKDGEKITSPQKFLNSLYGPGVFNPIEFFQAKPPERRKMLLAALDISITEEELAEKLGRYGNSLPLGVHEYNRNALMVLEDVAHDAYTIRADKAKEKKRLEASIESDRRDIPTDVDLNEYRDFDYDGKFAEYEEAAESIAKNYRKKESISALEGEANDISREIVALEDKLKDLREAGRSKVAEIELLQAQWNAFKAPDTESMKTALSGYQDAQKHLNKLEAISTREEELKQVTADHKKLDKAHKLLTTDIPKSLMSQAEFPVPGIEIAGDKISIDGIPIDKRSGSEQIKFAVTLAQFLSQNKELKVILVDGFEALSDTSRKAFIEATESDDFEYFITRVTDGELKVTT